MITEMRAIGAIAAVCLLAACEPRDDTPGLWLSGEEVGTPPADWTFTDDYREIALEVATPYLIRHSVTIWCAQVDGTLYVAAAAPDRKNWPGWAEENPDVRLKIGEDIYDVRLEVLTEDSEIAAVQAAYREKYDLENVGGGAPVRYWRVEA